MKNEAVTVRIPCSTSNLGSGFDTLGLALTLYNEVTVRRRLKRTGQPQGVGAMMIEEASALFFQRVKKRPFAIEAFSSEEIPIGRGLGASAALRVAILMALDHLSETKCSRERILQMGTELEGHPDNVSPELFGGFTVSGKVEGKFGCLKFQVSKKLEIAALVPEFKVNTEEARALLPAQFSREDTVHALNRAALITASFSSGNYEALRGLFDDRVHQPHRAPLVPQMKKVITAGENAGAIGGFLSGSGSAVICLSLRNGAAIAKAMQSQSPGSRVYRLRVDNDGCQVF